MKNSASILLSRSLRKTVSSLLIFFALAVSLTACSGSSPGEIAVGDTAPDFTLPASDGGSVALSDIIGERPALLYFHMALG